MSIPITTRFYGASGYPTTSAKIERPKNAEFRSLGFDQKRRTVPEIQAFWCLLGTKNGGSMQWSRMIRSLRVILPTVTTIVSYSDPSQGHTGALYKACNWVWAPTWHRLRPPPSGNGSWSGEVQNVKDRWIFAVKPDARRAEILRVKDDAVSRIITAA